MLQPQFTSSSTVHAISLISYHQKERDEEKGEGLKERGRKVTVHPPTPSTPSTPPLHPTQACYLKAVPWPALPLSHTPPVPRISLRALGSEWMSVLVYYPGSACRMTHRQAASRYPRPWHIRAWGSTKSLKLRLRHFFTYGFGNITITLKMHAFHYWCW